MLIIQEKYISFELCSNGYELGSSNILFHYYNKNIYLMTKSSIINVRYPLNFDLDSPKNLIHLENILTLKDKRFLTIAYFIMVNKFRYFY